MHIHSTIDDDLGRRSAARVWRDPVPGNTSMYCAHDFFLSFLARSGPLFPFPRAGGVCALPLFSSSSSLSFPSSGAYVDCFPFHRLCFGGTRAKRRVLCTPRPPPPSRRAGAGEPSFFFLSFSFFFLTEQPLPWTDIVVILISSQCHSVTATRAPLPPPPFKKGEGRITLRVHGVIPMLGW